LGGKAGFLFISIHVGDLYPNTGLENQPRESNVGKENFLFQFYYLFRLLIILFSCYSFFFFEK